MQLDSIGAISFFFLNRLSKYSTNNFMKNESSNILKSAIIVNKFGVHARSAAKIASLAVQAKKKIWIIKDDEKIDAASILDILTLGYPMGTRITFAAENETDIDILNNIIILVEKGFGE